MFNPTLLLLAQVAAAPAPQTAPSPPPSDDVVVTGLRDIDQPDSPVTARTLGSARTQSAAASRDAFSQEQTFAVCVGRRASPASLSLLRGALDGNINGARQSYAQAELSLLRRSCPGVDPVTGAPSSKSVYYQRGALTIDTLRRYAPDLQLTKKETGDPAVQSRFNLREVPRARFRLPVDMRYFETAVCLVRLQPELSVALTRADDLNQRRRIEAAIVNRARVCVGNARHVYFDGVQFRFYIADAVYRWAVAARNVDTLIPREP